MKTNKRTTNLTLIAFALIAFLSIGRSRLAAQQSTGIMGYETKHATVNFSDMQAYDAAHPELSTNIKNIPEAEYNHGDFMRDHGIGIQNATALPTHQEKHIETISPAPALTFSGEVSNGTEIPPDVFGAVGPTYIMTTHNQSVKISNKSGTQISSVTLDAFWSSVTAAGTFDPKSVYDPYSDRYIIVALYLDANSENSALLIGVSQANNPNGTWNLFNITVDATNTYWMDFPELGFNKNWIAVGGNKFNIANGSNAGAYMYVFNKGNLYANTNSQYTQFSAQLTHDFSVTPAMTYDGNDNSLFLLETYNSTSAQLREYKITGTPTTPVLNGPTTITGTIPWTASAPGGNDFGIQTSTTNKIDCGDDRFTSICFRNGTLWASCNAYLPANNPTRCSVEWWQLDTVGTIIQNSTIDDPSAANFYIYPAIVANSNNDAVISFTNLGSAIHPSGGYVYRDHADPVNTFESPYIYINGANTYYQTFGGTRNRWGDYTAVMVDPSDDATIWAVTEYAYSTANIWATYWAKITTCQAPATPSSIIGPNSICSTDTSGHYYSVASNSLASTYTWTVSGAGWTSVPSTSDSILIHKGTGTGTISVVLSNACGSNPAESLTVTIVTGLPVSAGPITGDTSVCGATSESYSINAVANATSYVWTVPSSWAGFSTTNTISTTVGSVSGVITVMAVNGCGTDTAVSINVTLPVAPSVAVTTDTINCGTSITLNATGASTLHWFNQPTGGTSLDTGGTFTTPLLFGNETYYVESDLGAPPEYMAPYDSTIGAGGYFNNQTNHYNIFNVTTACTLVSVQVYAEGAGNRTITMWNSSQTVLNSITVNLPNGPSRVTLNFPLAVGTGYELGVTGSNGQANLWRSTAGLNYPYNDPNGWVSIIGYNGGTNRYYYFYDWELSGTACISARTPINIIMNGGVNAGFTYTQTGTSTFTFTNTSTGDTSWLWNFGDGDTSTVLNPVHTYAHGGTKIVTLIVHNGACVDTMKDTIVFTITGINSIDASASLFVYPDPVTDNLTVNLSSLEAGVEWKISMYDILGQVVLSDKIITTTGTTQAILNVNPLSKGIYTLELQNNGSKLIRRIVKE